LNGEQLPMRVFDLRMTRIIYAAGSPATCARLKELMQIPQQEKPLINADEPRKCS